MQDNKNAPYAGADVTDRLLFNVLISADQSVKLRG